MNKWLGFKPYYKWITFNTNVSIKRNNRTKNGSFKPYYKWITFNTQDAMLGWTNGIKDLSFKPYYKWITFNTVR